MNHALVFDSGVGGLSVVREIRDLMPDLHLSFVADDAFRPYGEKPEAAIRGHLAQLMPVLDHMLRPDVIIVACNTASTTALPVIRGRVDIPVVGVVPAIKPAAERSRTGAIGVLGTHGTVRGEYVDALVRDFAGNCRVRLLGTPGLVVQAERKLSGLPVDQTALCREIAPLFEGRDGADIDAVVLACTHFPLLIEELQACLRQSVSWIDSGQAIARRVQSLLKDRPLRAAPPTDQTAFLIGPNLDVARRKAFEAEGFRRVVGLEP